MIDLILPSLLLLLLFLFIHRLPSIFPQSTLPTHILTKPRTSTVRTRWILERHDYSISLYTKSLNPLPRYLLSRYASKSHAKRVVNKFYDLGIFVGCFGGFVSCLGGIWAMVTVWITVWNEIQDHAGVEREIRGSVISRAKDGGVMTMMAGGGLQPLIPGITTPLSHLPTLVLALLINQLIHELGHAIAAALDDINPSRFNFNLHYIIPSATVAFPKTVDYLSSKGRMRLATSGPLNNLIVYLVLGMFALLGAGNLFYTDRGNVGRVVQFVNPRSPLYGHLQVGEIITHLDEVSIAGPEDRWGEYLNGHEVSDDGRGWCLNYKLFRAAPLQPCMRYSDKVLFRPLSSPTFENTKCLSPLPMLHEPSTKCPCDDPDMLCVAPIPEEKLLRIRIKDGGKSGMGRVVLWSGDRRGVLAALGVGKEGARLFEGITRWGTLFFEYMNMISLSLFLFNLLPLPYTDGSQLLQAILSRTSRKSNSTSLHFQATLSTQNPTLSPLQGRHNSEDTDDEDLYPEDNDDEAAEGRRANGGYRMEEAWKRRLRRGVEIGTMGVCGSWMAGWGLLALLRSS